MPQHYNAGVFALYCCGNSLYVALLIYSYWVSAASLNHSTNALMLTTAAAIAHIVSVSLQWTIWFVKASGEAGKDTGKGGLAAMQIFFPILSSAAVLLRLCSAFTTASSINQGSTVSFVFTHEAGHDHNCVSLTFLLELMFTPILAFYLLRDTFFAAIWISWAVNCAVLITYGLAMRSTELLLAVVMYAFACIVLYFDTMSSFQKNVRLVNKLQETLSENERLANDAQAQELRAMIGNIAHDLKSPLTSFLSGVECMLEVVTSWDALLSSGKTEQFLSSASANLSTIKKCLQSMSGTNSFMTMTINRCLDYTRATRGLRLLPKQETFSLPGVLEMPIKMMRDVQKKIEIRLMPPLSESICSHIITDKQWLLENLLCLLSNAVKYSLHGCVEVGMNLRDSANKEVVGLEKVTLRHRDTPHTLLSDEPDLFLRFEVQDTGIGLSDEAMQTLFNPFKQAQRMAGGTGLGLFSLAKRVEALQGQYGVSRRPDGAQGSLFWFTIPYRPDPLSAEMCKNSQYGSTCSTQATPSVDSERSHTMQLQLPDLPDREHKHDPLFRTSPKLNVLVVDDAPLIVKMTTMLLTRKGHTVSHAINGAEALELILAGYEEQAQEQVMGQVMGQVMAAPPYDVVVMDLQMPIMDGIEALQRLRAAEASRKAKHAEEYEKVQQEVQQKGLVPLEELVETVPPALPEVEVKNVDPPTLDATQPGGASVLSQDSYGVTPEVSSGSVSEESYRSAIDGDSAGNSDISGKSAAGGSGGSDGSGSGGGSVGAGSASSPSPDVADPVTTLLPAEPTSAEIAESADPDRPTRSAASSICVSKSNASTVGKHCRYHQFVIAVSANSDADTVRAALKAGADAFVSKPFAYDSFADIMQQQGRW